MSFESHLPAFMKELVIKSADGLAAAGLHLMSKQKQALSVSAHRGRGPKGIVYEASKPGESPRLRLGTLRQSVTMSLDKAALVAKVGIPQTTIYGFWLEVGTRWITQRPWMSKTLEQEMGTIAMLAASEWD